MKIENGLFQNKKAISNRVIANAALVGLVSSLGSVGCATASSVPTVKSALQNKLYTFESDGNGFNTKNYFYDNGEEVVVFDTQFTPDLAQKSVDYIRSQTQNPITYVVITHPNPDKFNGMSVFQKLGAKVIASQPTQDAMQGVHDYKKYFFVNMAKMFTEESYPRLSKADIVFNKNLDLRLGNGETIYIKELGAPGISSNQTIAYIPQEKALIVGDLVHHQAHAWLEGGITDGKPTPQIKSWINCLKQLQVEFKGLPETLVYGGRGKVALLSEAIPAQVEYLLNAVKTVETYIANLGEKRTELQGAHAGAHYQALQAEFERAYPNYQ